MSNLNEIATILRKADAICFDVDSTVIQEEAIDELAKFCGKGEQVANLTQLTMSGNMTFREALAMRLNMIHPNQFEIEQFIHMHPPTFTPGIESLVRTLQQQNKQIFLVSGGFRQLIGPIAEKLNIPPHNIYSNNIKFHGSGEYGGFDEKEPTSKNNGKAEVIRLLKEQYGFEFIIHIGDGATDLETSYTADAFIGFGGNIVRQSVQANARWYIMDFIKLNEALNYNTF